MTVAYDGSGFHGFADNPGVPTVGGTLARSIEQIVRDAVELTCAGRTDTGVHAWGQVVSVDLRDDVDLIGLQRGLNKLCAPAIAVREIAVAPPEFDARFSARGRIYRYTVLNREAPDPFLAATAWHVEKPLDIELLHLTCDPFVGEHDFSAFCRRPKRDEGEDEPSMVRVVRRAAWTEVAEDVLRFEIEASSFCHQMVRSVVGTMVAAALGRMRPGDLAAVIRSRDRSRAGDLAPPHGLCLWDVRY
jgi:tRNA pseudouridine38-40 synthase